jgi:protein SCO1/2
MRRRRPFVLGVLLVIALVACRREAPAPAGARHPLKGRAVSVDVARRAITVAHEDVPGFMPAMTMEFTVLEKDALLLGQVSPGDEITATLVVPDSRYWLEDLVVVKRGEPGPGAPPLSRAPVASVGEALPDVPLVDQDGRPFRLSGLRGHAFALTFVYTRCPLPDFCPLMMRNFAAAEARLAGEPALFERTRLLTVSFDPKHDTPAVLRAFGRPFQKTAPPFSHWLLATGTEKALRELGQALELDYVEQTASFTHNLRTAVVDPQGRLLRLLRGNEWKPEELVAALREAGRP